MHDAPVYPTTQTTAEIMGLRLVTADFHSLQSGVLKADAALVQYARQKPDDHYDMAEVLKAMPFVKSASIANAQSKVLLVEFTEDIAEVVLEEAQKLGALPHPVGAESRYEVPPLFYKVSGTFLEDDPSLKTRMIRINPNRVGAETVLKILNEAHKAAKSLKK